MRLDEKRKSAADVIMKEAKLRKEEEGIRGFQIYVFKVAHSP